ncbi:hypothetical protein [Halorussus marinus]|uniref:hypothetical protein n=1 Tax=Halorussus marinus TaxID=2505976 RepID=UPI0010926B19|nr:hypothetical protein [Halorussus marinus]
MSKTITQSSTSTTDDLLDRFANVRGVFQDRVVAKPNGSGFHRLALDASADQPTPACPAGGSASDWQLVPPATVRQSGLTPCESCYKAIFEHLAADPESPVEPRRTPIRSREFGEQFEDDEELFEPLELPSISSLAVLTQEVLVRGGSSKVMHAPTTDGPLCGQSGEYRHVVPDALGGHYRPCQECFATNRD